MRRISSLPVSEYCGKADEIGTDVETTNAKRSTVFHKYCETGSWPDMINTLPESDKEEISKWKVPKPLKLTIDGKEIILKYKDSIKEIRVAVDGDFNFIDVPHETPLADIQQRFPSILCIGHLDMAWDIPDLDLVVVNDIKSSIFAVKARTKSLQLHGYGFTFAKKMGRSRYLTAIWDACDGRHYCEPSEIIDLDSFEAEEYKDRIRNASRKNSETFVTGTHCGGCWKKQSCPAHLMDLPKDSDFSDLYGPNVTEKVIRDSLVKLRKMKDSYEKGMDVCKGWVESHGPVRSEDGSKEWTVALRSGRMSLDQKAVEAEYGSLEKFMKKGNDYPVFDWRNKKE